MLKGSWQGMSVARRLAVTAVAGTVAAGALVATSVTAHAALPVTPIVLAGSHIPANVKSVKVGLWHFSKGRYKTELHPTCVDVTTPGQDVEMGISAGGDAKTAGGPINAVRFAANFSDCESADVFNGLGSDFVAVPSELPTTKWWIELDKLLVGK